MQFNLLSIWTQFVKRVFSFPQEADESLNFEEQILEAARAITGAASALVKAAASAQRELVASGRVRHSGTIGDLSFFYWNFHGHCSQEIRDIIPVPLRHVRTTRSSTHSHPFQVSLPNPRTLSHKSSFIPRTCNLWNVFSSSCFPESYNLPSFNSTINKLDLISLSSLPFTCFFLPFWGFVSATVAFPNIIN